MITEDQIIDQKVSRIDYPSFSREWWSSFYHQTEGLNKPKVFKDVLNKEHIAKFYDCVFNIVKDVSTRKISQGFRVSIDGELDGKNLNYFHNSPPSQDENLVEWCNRVFGEKKFGVILNSCQNFDILTKSEISEKFKYLLEDYGIPPNGLEITLFFGNYGYTPIGFHLDPIGHKVTHLHLGPGSKQMYLIDKGKFEKDLEAKAGSKDWQKLIPNSEVYEFNEGDVFFMPVGVYHVGNTEELSFGLTIWHIEPAVSEFQARLSIDLMKKIFSKESSGMMMRDKMNVEDTSNMWEKLNEVIEYDSDYEGMTLREAVDTLIREHRYKLFSNGYFYGFLQNLEAEITPKNFEATTIVRGIEPFKIYYYERVDKVFLFIQGKKLELPKHKAIGEIVDKINSYLPVTVDDLFKKVQEDWDMDLILHIAGQIFIKGGLKVN